MNAVDLDKNVSQTMCRKAPHVGYGMRVGLLQLGPVFVLFIDPFLEGTSSITKPTHRSLQAIGRTKREKEGYRISSPIHKGHSYTRKLKYAV